MKRTMSLVHREGCDVVLESADDDVIAGELKLQTYDVKTGRVDGWVSADLTADDCRQLSAWLLEMAGGPPKPKCPRCGCSDCTLATDASGGYCIRISPDGARGIQK